MSPAPDPLFYEVGVRTHFSFLEGASSAEELVVSAKMLGIAGLGIADRNTLAGVVRGHAKAGFERSRYQPGARLVFADGTPDILAYPRNRAGWAHLCRLLSAGNLRSDKGSCTLFLDDLLEWQADLQLILVPGPAPIDWAALKACLARLKAAAGDRLYLALVPRYDGFDRLHLESLMTLARDFGLRPIATNDVLYHEPGRRPLADVVTAIREHVTVAQAGLRLAANAERFLKSPAEMARLFRDCPEALANTRLFFKGLRFSLDELKHNYPDETGPGETPAEALKRRVREGAAVRYPDGVPEKVEQQLAYELELIHEKQYEPYFLTVDRMVAFARSKGILCQGRGSAANSSVCFCLGVTEVDPIKFTLLFDRFLSRDRDEPPDIDIDFEHARREEVIQFLYRTYTKEHAGLAAAVISYRARSAGREVAKAFGFSEDVQAALAGSIWGWWTSGFTEDQAKAAGLDLADPTVSRLFTYAGMLMDYPRHLSQHVGGFVITRDRLDEIVPIMPTAMPDRYMIEWNKDDLDVLNILKVDVLALGMLTALAKAFTLLETHYGKQKVLREIFETEDPKVYDMICRADTIGVFQIESRAQMSMLPRLRPRKFYDLVIEVAIVRPGPIQGDMVHPYLKRREAFLRHGVEPDYAKPELKSVLERTLGVPLFQEQAMQIAITAAHFTPAEADKLRRAMATFRRTGQVANFELRMIEGMVENGYEREFAQRCFNQIKGFGEYGFPESHAASFALLVYASSWFKTFYPDIFCAALLNAQPMGFYAPAQLVRDAREHGVEVLPVDINHSDWETLLEAGQAFDRRRIDPRHRTMQDVILTERSVRLGFRIVKGLRETDMAVLTARRGAGYRSVHDLWVRSGLSRAVLERLADADAFRSIGLDRRRALWAVKALDEKGAAERLPLFAGVEEDLIADPAVALPEMPPGEQVVHDYRALTLSLKAHPVSFMREVFARAGVVTTRALLETRPGRRVTVAGLVLVRQRPGTAQGVIFMTLEDETGVANVIVWKTVFAQYRPVVMGARLVKVTGRLQSQSGVIHVIAERIEDMTAALGLLKGEERRFAVNERADEVLRPMIDQRQKQAQAARLAAREVSAAGVGQTEPDRDQAKSNEAKSSEVGASEALARKAAASSFGTPRQSDRALPEPSLFDQADTARVMPKGRNFH